MRRTQDREHSNQISSSCPEESGKDAIASFPSSSFLGHAPYSGQVLEVNEIIQHDGHE